MKFGIIGTGMIGNFHAKAIGAIESAEISGVYDRNPERTREFAEKYGAPAYDTLEDMLAGDNVEIVSIGTPSGAHFEPAMAAIEAGKHVIVEKPLEVTVEKIDKMSAAAEAKGVTLAAVLNRRFHPAMDAFKAATDAGRFGTLASASAYVKWFRGQAYYDSAGWRGTWALDGGGALMNQSIHTIDALLYLAGPVKSVQANTACLAHVNIEVEDTAVAIVEFANRARGVIEGNTCAWSSKGHPSRVQLSGTQGSVFLADEFFEEWDFAEPAESDEQVRENLMQAPTAGLGANDPSAIDFYQHQRNFEEVIAAIQEGRSPTTDYKEARKSVELIQAIYRSAQNDGEKIILDA